MSTVNELSEKNKNTAEEIKNSDLYRPYIEWLVKEKFPFVIHISHVNLVFTYTSGDEKHQAEQYASELFNMLHENGVYPLKKMIKEIIVTKDITAFFNDEDAMADFEFWSKMQHWTLDEFIALLLRKNPEKVSFGKIMHFLNFKDEVFHSPFATEYAKLRAIIVRSCPLPPLSSNLVHAEYELHHKLNIQKTPEELLRLASALGLPIPENLRGCVEKKLNRAITMESMQKQINDFNQEFDGVNFKELQENDCFTFLMQQQILASKKFWIPTRQGKRKGPLKKEVVAYFEERGIKNTVAEQLTANIRPDWATKGRPKDK